MDGLGIDWTEVVRRALKYLFEGLAVAIAAHYIPKKKMSLEDIAMISITAAATLAILDMYSPGMGGAARFGVGSSVGAGLAGGLPVASPTM